MLTQVPQVHQFRFKKFLNLGFHISYVNTLCIHYSAKLHLILHQPLWSWINKWVHKEYVPYFLVCSLFLQERVSKKYCIWARD